MTSLVEKFLGAAVAAALSLLIFSACGGSGDSSDRSVARLWDEAALGAVRIDIPRPPVHARNLWHLSLAMYDAWAVYDATARGYLTREKLGGLSQNAVVQARREAISYAAYRVLTNH